MLLEFTKAIDIFKDNGFDLKSNYPLLYRRGNDLGVAYTFNSINYGVLERYKLFNSEKDLDMFLKELKWYKEFGNKKKVYLKIDNFEKENPNYFFIHNGKEITYENMVNIDKFDEDIKKELEGSDIKRITFEIERLFEYYKKVKEYILDYIDSVNKSLDELFESYKLLQKRIDIYNNLNIDRNIEEIEFKKISISFDVAKENNLKDTLNQYKVGDNTYEEFVTLLKKVWSLCMELELKDDYINAMRVKNDVVNEQNLVNLKLDYMEKIINKKSLFKGIKNIAKKFRRIERKFKSVKLDDDYEDLYFNKIVAKYSMYENMHIFNTYAYLEDAFEFDGDYNELAKSYKERKELDLSSGFNDVDKNIAELRDLYNKLDVVAQDKLIILNSEYYDLLNMIINIDDYKIKTGEDLLSILSINNEFNKIMERCYSLVSEILPFNEAENIKRIFSYINFNSQEEFLLSLVSILDDLETISEKIIIKNPIIGYFKTYNADNFVDKMIKADLDVSNTLCDIKSKDLRYIVANIGSNIRGAFSYLTLNIPRNGETEISVVNSDKIAFYIFTNSTIIDKSSEVLKVVDYRGDVVREANYSYVERLNKELEFNFVNWDVNRKL